MNAENQDAPALHYKGNSHVPHCVPCWDNAGKLDVAKFVAAQSSDQGQNVSWVCICAGHALDWNEGGDWEAPMFPIGAEEEV